MSHRNLLPFRPQGLHATDQFLRTLFDNSRAAFFLKDLDGRYLLVNRRCLELLQNAYGSVVGRSDHELFDRSRADAQRALDRRVIKTGSSVEAEQEIFTGFEQRIYRITEWPVFDQAGNSSTRRSCPQRRSRSTRGRSPGYPRRNGRPSKMPSFASTPTSSSGRSTTSGPMTLSSPTPWRPAPARRVTAARPPAVPARSAGAAVLP